MLPERRGLINCKVSEKENETSLSYCQVSSEKENETSFVVTHKVPRGVQGVESHKVQLRLQSIHVSISNTSITTMEILRQPWKLKDEIRRISL